MRMRANTLCCWAEEWMTHSGVESDGRCTTDPVQLLCRALRLTPVCYRRFEIAAAQPDAPIVVKSEVFLCWPDEREHRSKSASFEGLAQLEAAVRREATKEGLCSRLSPDQRSIVVHRADAGAL